MSSPIITKVIEEMNDLPDDLQQQVLKFVVTLRQQHLQNPGNAWDVLKSNFANFITTELLGIQSKPDLLA